MWPASRSTSNCSPFRRIGKWRASNPSGSPPPAPPASRPLAGSRPSKRRAAASLRSADRAGREDASEGRHDVALAPLDPERGDLHDEHVLVAIDDEPREAIALGVDHAVGGRLGQVPVTDLVRRPDPPFEEVGVDRRRTPSQQPDPDARSAVVGPDAEQPVPRPLDPDEIAVLERRGRGLDRAVEDPGMPRRQPPRVARADRHDGQARGGIGRHRRAA